MRDKTSTQVTATSTNPSSVSLTPLSSRTLPTMVLFKLNLAYRPPQNQPVPQQPNKQYQGHIPQHANQPVQPTIQARIFWIIQKKLSSFSSKAWCLAKHVGMMAQAQSERLLAVWLFRGVFVCSASLEFCVPGCLSAWKGVRIRRLSVTGVETSKPLLKLTVAERKWYGFRIWTFRFTISFFVLILLI